MARSLLDCVSIGIDPGTVRVGVAIVTKNGGALRHVCHRLLPLEPGLKGGERLLDLKKKFEALIGETNPTVAGIERLFFSKNKKTALAVGEARGIILAVLAAHGIPVVEFTPPEIKLAVAGYGNAPKAAVAKMAGTILGIKTKGSVDDATDALAIAIAATQRRIG